MSVFEQHFHHRWLNYDELTVRRSTPSNRLTETVLVPTVELNPDLQNNPTLLLSVDTALPFQDRALAVSLPLLAMLVHDGDRVLQHHFVSGRLVLHHSD